LKQKKKSKSSKAAEPLSPSRKRLFTIVLILFPVVFFLVAEFILRWTEYGGDLRLVVKKTVVGKEYYALNRGVARRYFSQANIAVPELGDDLFEIEKGPKTRRIFMLGESTMAGFPFEYNATAPSLLNDRLKQDLPEYKIEVINVGLSAVNSYTVLDFAKELTQYAPDAFIVYVGHNEFYGAMGVGSTEYFGQWRWMINTYLKLRDLRLFLFLRDGMIKLRNLFQSDANPRQSTVMEMMVKEKTILYNSPEYLQARSNYEANLRELIELCREHGIPLVLSTMTSNIRDQKPLLSTFTEDVPEQTKQQWQAVMKQGTEFERSNRFAEAIERYRSAIALDSMQADAHFALARCYGQQADMVSAKREYVRARDYDGLRFRATSDFNTLLRNLCRETGIPLADADLAFEEQSPNALPGKNLFLEHLHPNFDGYFLLAKTFCQALVSHDILAPNREWDQTTSDEEFKRLSGVTPFDLEVANYRTVELTHHWPFVQTGSVSVEYPTHDKAGELAVQYAKRKIGWSKARYALAEWYNDQNEYRNALKEYYALSKVMWYNYMPVMFMGDMAKTEGDTVQAKELYFKSLSLAESPFVRVRLGMLFNDLHQPDNAIEQFETMFRDGSLETTMNASDRSLARYFLAAAYWEKNNREKSVENLQRAVQINPKNSDARSLLTTITSQQAK